MTNDVNAIVKYTILCTGFWEKNLTRGRGNSGGSLVLAMLCNI